MCVCLNLQYTCMQPDFSKQVHENCHNSSRRARPARSVLDFSLCFQLSCFFFLFLFLFLFFAFVYFFPSSSPFLFFFFYISISLSVACLCASSLFLLGTQTWHLARFIAHPKLYSSLSLFSSKPIKLPEWL